MLTAHPRNSDRYIFILSIKLYFSSRGHNPQDPVSVLKVRAQEAAMIQQWVMKKKYGYQ